MREIAHWAVARHESRFVSKWQEILGDRINQIRMIAERKVRPADRSLKQNIAHDRQFGGRMMEYYMTWRVAGAVYHVERQIADGNLVAIIQPAIRFENRSINSIAAAVFPQPGNPEAIRPMRAFSVHTEFIRHRAGFSHRVHSAWVLTKFHISQAPL